MKIAAIDIGTNTVLMTIKNLETGKIIADYSEIARLGEGLNQTGLIGQDGMVRLFTILKRYSDIVYEMKVDQVFPIATSAMRDAGNRESVINFIQENTGLKIRVITGEEEAVLTYHGGLDGLNIPARMKALIDIGGGSTEYILGDGQTIQNKMSLNIGTVRLSEKFNLTGEDISVYRLEDFAAFVKTELKKLPFSGSPEISWIGVAGTPTSLSAVLQKLSRYDADAVHGSNLTRQQLNELTAEFISISPNEILKRYPILAKRHDLMLAGCLILKCSFEHFGIEYMTVSDRGLRYGVLKSFPNQ